MHKEESFGVGQNRSAGLEGIRVDDRPRHAASEHIYACNPLVDQRASKAPCQFKMLCCMSDERGELWKSQRERTSEKEKRQGESVLYCDPRVDRLGGTAKTLPVAFGAGAQSGFRVVNVSIVAGRG